MEERKFSQAEKLYQRAIEVQKTAVGRNHYLVGIYTADLAEMYQVQGRYAAAEPLFEEALLVIEKSLGSDHPEVADILENQAKLYRAVNEPGRAKKLEKRAAKIRQQK